MLLQVIGNLGCVYLVVITALICFGAMPGCNPPAATSGSTAGGGGFDDYQGLELELALDPVMSDLQSVTHAGNHTPPAPEHRSALACGGEPEVVPPVKYLQWDLNWNGAGKHTFLYDHFPMTEKRPSAKTGSGHTRIRTTAEGERRRFFPQGMLPTLPRCSRSTSLRSLAHRSVKKRSIYLCMTEAFMYKTDQFTKTGSGQTQEKL